MGEYVYHLYKIKALTNVHAGSGEANFGVVDNLVQRDGITGYPAIFSSSLKGAFREFFSSFFEGDSSKLDEIFGSENNSGAYRFFQANLLALPLRSNKKPYFLCFSDEILYGLISSMNNNFIDEGRLPKNIMVNLKNGISFINSNKGNSKGESFFANAGQIGSDKIKIEDCDVINNDSNAAKVIESMACLIEGKSEDAGCLAGKLAFAGHDTVFKNFAKNLPVIARNHLDNGQSDNLWYEEVVPRYAMFYFFIGVPKNNKLFDEFNRILEDNIVQIGANATIGYGYCKINKIL